MAKITKINIGTIPNDGTGDTARNAAIKMNEAMRTVETDNLLTGDGTIGNPLSVVQFGGGKILQVVQTHVITPSSQAITGKVATNVFGLNASIIPKSSASRIHISVRWTGESSLSQNYNTTFGIRRGVNAIGNANAYGVSMVGIAGLSQGSFMSDANSTMDNTYYEYIDSPTTTSSLIYFATITSLQSITLYNNRTVTQSTTINGFERLTSTIILMEIGV